MVDFHPPVTGYPQPSVEKPAIVDKLMVTMAGKDGCLQKDGDFSRKDGDFCKPDGWRWWRDGGVIAGGLIDTTHQVTAVSNVGMVSYLVRL